MKRVKYLVFSLLVLFLGFGVCNAASLSVETNKTSVQVDGTVTITVTATGAAGWEYCLDYNSNMFSLTSSTSDTGGACVRTGSTLIGYGKVTYKLKAKKSGTSKVTVRDYAMYGDDGNSISTNVNSVTIVAKTQAEIEASYSTNADLKLLDVSNYDIEPAFNKDTLEYSLEVENDVEKINIIANKADSSATVSGAGEKPLLEGNNKFEIIVTAEKGNKKTYILNVVRKELNPIKRTIDGVDYTVVRKADNIEAPSYYTLETTTIDDEEVPAWKSEITGYTLLALKDEDGNITFFKYANNSVEPYYQLYSDAFVFIVEETSNRVKGYDVEKQVIINEVKVDGFVTKNNSEYVLIYGMNASNGEKGWYLFDTKENTFQRYNNSIVVEEKKEGTDLYFILSIVFAGVSGISILLLILVMVKNSKIRQKNEKLIEIVENKIEKRDQKIAERFDSFSDLDDEQLRELEETIKMQREINATKALELNKEMETQDEEDKGEIKEEVSSEVLKTDEIAKIEDPEEAIIANIAKANDKSFDSEDEIKKEIEPEEDSNIAEDIEVEDIMEEPVPKKEKKKKKVEPVTEEISYTQRLIEEPVNQNLSKRELRRLEKIRKQEEKDELKRMQEDFFKTNEYEMKDDTGTIDVSEDSIDETGNILDKKDNKKRK